MVRQLTAWPMVAELRGFKLPLQPEAVGQIAMAEHSLASARELRLSLHVLSTANWRHLLHDDVIHDVLDEGPLRSDRVSVDKP